MQRRTRETLIALIVLAGLFGLLLRFVILVEPELRPVLARDFGPIPVGTRALLAGVERVGVPVTGELEPVRRLSIRAETGGRVVQALAPWRPGTHVDAGTLLFGVDRRPSELALVAAAARVAEARAALGASKVDVKAAAALLPSLQEALDVARRLRLRLEALAESGEVSINAVDTALVGEKQAGVALQDARSVKLRLEAGLAVGAASIKSAEAAADQARDALGRLEFRAPFSGVLAGAGPQMGALLLPGAELGELVDVSSLRLLAQVHESKLPDVEVGAEVTVSLPSRPGLAVRGTVERMAPVADPQTRSFTVEIAIVQNTEQPLAAGSFAQGVVAPVGPQRLPDALGIERHEFVWHQGKPVAFVFADGQVEARELKLGQAIGEGFLVLAGLAPGEQLVLEPLDRMNPTGTTGAVLKP